MVRELERLQQEEAAAQAAKKARAAALMEEVGRLTHSIHVLQFARGNGVKILFL